MGCPPLSRTTAWQNPKTGQTIPQSCLRMPAPFAQGSYGGGRCGGAPSSHASPYGKEAKRLPLPPLMVRGGGATPLHASPYGKGRCHGVTEGIRKSVFDKTNRNAKNQSAKRRRLSPAFYPRGNGMKGQKRGRGGTGGKNMLFLRASLRLDGKITLHPPQFPI